MFFCFLLFGIFFHWIDSFEIFGRWANTFLKSMLKANRRFLECCSNAFINRFVHVSGIRRWHGFDLSKRDKNKTTSKERAKSKRYLCDSPWVIFLTRSFIILKSSQTHWNTVKSCRVHTAILFNISHERVEAEHCNKLKKKEYLKIIPCHRSDWERNCKRKIRFLSSYVSYYFQLDLLDLSCTLNRIWWWWLCRCHSSYRVFLNKEKTDRWMH